MVITTKKRVGLVTIRDPVEVAEDSSRGAVSKVLPVHSGIVAPAKNVFFGVLCKHFHFVESGSELSSLWLR
jgi:hypothetical protein